MVDWHYYVPHTHVCMTGESGSDHNTSDLLIYLETKKGTLKNPLSPGYGWAKHILRLILSSSHMSFWQSSFSFLSPTYLSLSIASFSCFLYLLILISISLNSVLYMLLLSTSNLLQFLLCCTPYRKTVSPKIWGSLYHRQADHDQVIFTRTIFQSFTH